MKATNLVFKLLFCIICLAMCQSCMTALLMSSLADSGPKAKMITYDEGYIGKGEIKKKEFYSGRQAVFYTNSMSPIIEGKITYDNSGQAYIKGDWHIASQNLLKGTFLISNTPEGLLSANKNAGKLQISVTDIEEFKTTEFHLKKLTYDRNSIMVDGVSDNAIDKIEGEVKREYVEKYGYDNVTELLKNVTGCQVTMKDNSTFSGNIAIAGRPDNNFSIMFKNGVWNLRSQLIKNITVSVPSTITGQTTITTNLYNSNVRTVEFLLPTEKLNNNVIQLFKQSNEGKLTYTSSDQFEGTYNVTITNDGKIDVVPLKGIFTLCGGQKMDDNWIDEYDLTEKEKTYVKRQSTPISQFEVANALINDKRYNEYYSLAESALSKKQYQKAITLYEEAGKYKNAEEMKSKIREIESKIEEEQKTQRILDKYGTYWGNLVLRKEFTIGMTREMCADMVSTARYEISKSVNRYGGTHESWWYNGSDEIFADALFDNPFITAMASEKAKQYPYVLEFENNKLVRISYRE